MNKKQLPETREGKTDRRTIVGVVIFLFLALMVIILDIIEPLWRLVDRIF